MWQEGVKIKKEMHFASLFYINLKQYYCFVHVAWQVSVLPPIAEV